MGAPGRIPAKMPAFSLSTWAGCNKAWAAYRGAFCLCRLPIVLRATRVARPLIGLEFRTPALLGILLFIPSK
jgi:hypothetical protein